MLYPRLCYKRLNGYRYLFKIKRVTVQKKPAVNVFFNRLSLYLNYFVYNLYKNLYLLNGKVHFVFATFILRSIYR